MIGVMLVFTDLMVRGLYAQIGAAKNAGSDAGMPTERKQAMMKVDARTGGRDRRGGERFTSAFSFDSICGYQYDGNMTDRPHTPLLDTVDVPADLRKLKPEDLRQFADELRAEMISAVGTTGGHLGSGLGVVELTTALHYVFDTPRDKIVWDVGHQCYPHKIITGRRDRIRTLRTGGGLSGFTKRSESEYDPFGAAHSSTSISAALGFGDRQQAERRARARDRGDRRRIDVGGHGL